MKKSGTILLLIAIPFALFPQSVVRLSECRMLVKENYTGKAQINYIEKGAAAQIKALQKIIRPNIRAFAGGSYFSDVPNPSQALEYSFDFIPLSKDFYNGGILLSQRIYDGGEYKSKKDKMHLHSELEKLKVMEAMEELEELVDVLFLNTLLIRNNAEVMYAEEELLRTRLLDAELLFESGKIFRKEVLEIETALLQLTSRISGLQAEEKKYLEMLSGLTGKAFTTEDVFLVPIEETAEPEKEILAFSAINLLLNQAGVSQKISQSEALPKLSLFATGGYGRPGLNYYDRTANWFGIVGISLQIPLTGWRDYKHARMYIAAENDRLTSQYADLQKHKKVREIEQDNEIRKYMELEQKDALIIASYTKIEEEAKLLFNQGEISMTDYLTAVRSGTNARLNKEKHRIERIKAQLKRKRITVNFQLP